MLTTLPIALPSVRDCPGSVVTVEKASITRVAVVADLTKSGQLLTISYRVLPPPEAKKLHRSALLCNVENVIE